MPPTHCHDTGKYKQYIIGTMCSLSIQVVEVSRSERVVSKRPLCF